MPLGRSGIARRRMISILDSSRDLNRGTSCSKRLFAIQTMLRLSRRALARSGDGMRITLVSGMERPMRLTLPYQPRL